MGERLLVGNKVRERFSILVVLAIAQIEGGAIVVLVDFIVIRVLDIHIVLIGLVVVVDDFNICIVILIAIILFLLSGPDCGGCIATVASATADAAAAADAIM